MTDLNLKGQIIIGLFRSYLNDDWNLLETNKSTFEIRLGGLNSTTEKRSKDLSIDLPVIGKKIKTVKTDDHSIYFELENGECLIHSDTFIDADGNIDFEFRLVDKTDFDIERQEWYDSNNDLKEIK
ncbi:hypothetical protein [Mangrovimonas sp. YM274]|uniref:hypothetical protein n=1 Tax=Mangrovimonas sp. YM274 TaxID=3070660 RepID=UPI0027DABB01|nr:hypothetical protein [Mangrovimonas sp. YM274]WMI68226.1 hypothetical protein RBH95_13880 [Mangrovimonas sp. YM274]